MRTLKHRKHMTRVRRQPLMIKGLPDPFDRAVKFNASFESALTVTRSFTLSRDVQGCVEDALRREMKKNV